jgi:hypothetical protein
VGPEPVWIGAENLAPLGFDPRTFQPVVSRHTDYAIPAPRILYGTLYIIMLQMHMASYCNFVSIQFKTPVRGFDNPRFSRYYNFKWD